MATEYSLEITLGYTHTDFQRTYKMETNQTAAQSAASKIVAYNADIPAADKKVFIANEYDDTDPNNVIGELSGIVAARVVKVTETQIV